MIPLLVWVYLVKEDAVATVLVLLLSGVTDVVDGYIARHYNMITNFGKVYDPFVDKLMQITAVVCLCLIGLIPPWLILFVLLKEFAMIIIGGILYLKKIVVYSHWYGKATTVILYAIVITLIFWQGITPLWATLLFGFLVLSMLFSGLAYLVDIIRHHDEKRVEK